MRKYNFKINKHSYSIDILAMDNNVATVDVNGILYEVQFEEELKPAKPIMQRKDFVPSADALPTVKTYLSENGKGIVRSPLPGKVVDLLVKEGDRVAIGQTLICIEAMKMENSIRADRDGIVKSILVQTNDVVIEGQLLLEIV